MSGQAVVRWLDPDGLPRAWAAGEVDNMEDLQAVKDVARDMLEEYINEPGHTTRNRNIDEYTQNVQFTPLQE
jgi:hypothetical protein